MDAKDYRADPCRASSLPFWKTEQVSVPENITILREDQFDASESRGADEPYFRLIHRLEGVERPVVPEQSRESFRDVSFLRLQGSCDLACDPGRQ